MTPSDVLYQLAGSPPQDEAAALPVGSRCRVCGSACGRGLPYVRWQGPTFTDQCKLRDWSAEHVCEPCIWAHAWNVPPGFPPPEPGKKGVNLRLYSHFYDERGYHAWNKANKREIRDWLRAPKSGKWFAAIADTGQKHVLPWTPFNHGPHGVVRLEEQSVRLGDFALVDAICGLLTAGATKEEIESGTYTERSWKLARGRLEAFEAAFGSALRRGGWFSLALWLSQRDEEQVSERLAAERAAKETRRADTGAERTAVRRNRRGVARDESGVSGERRKPAQALGSDSGPTAVGGAADEHELGVGHGADAQPRPEQSKRQLGLFR